MTLSGTAILTKIRKFPQFGGSESHTYNPSQSTVKVEKTALDRGFWSNRLRKNANTRQNSLLPWHRPCHAALARSRWRHNGKLLLRPTITTHRRRSKYSCSRHGFALTFDYDPDFPIPGQLWSLYKQLHTQCSRVAVGGQTITRPQVLTRHPTPTPTVHPCHDVLSACECSGCSWRDVAVVRCCRDDVVVGREHIGGVFWLD